MKDKYVLYNNDCIEQMQKLIEENVKVDLVLTDIPYGVTACKWDSVIPFDEMWDCIDKLSSSETVPVLLFGTEPFSSKLRLSNITNYKYDWVWNKEVGVGIFNREYQPLNDYELISVFYKKAGQYYPIMTTSTHNKSFKRNKCKSNTMSIKFNDSMEYKDSGKRFPKRILTFNSRMGELNNTCRVHPTQKPVALLEYLIKTYTEPEEIVLDFTMGSGSTGVACMNTGRKFIGIELEKEYYDIACERLEEASGNGKQTKLI